jgi:hypothetical protein
MYAMVKLEPNSTGYNYFDSKEVGYEMQFELYHYLQKRLSKKPVVIEHADMVRDPASTLSKLCSALGIAFDSAMLRFSVPLPTHASGLW